MASHTFKELQAQARAQGAAPTWDEYVSIPPFAVEYTPWLIVISVTSGAPVRDVNMAFDKEELITIIQARRESRWREKWEDLACIHAFVE